MVDNKDGPAMPKEPTPGASTSNGPSAAPEAPKKAPKPQNPVFKMMGELTIHPPECDRRRHIVTWKAEEGNSSND